MGTVGRATSSERIPRSDLVLAVFYSVVLGTLSAALAARAVRFAGQGLGWWALAMVVVGVVGVAVGGSSCPRSGPGPRPAGTVWPGVWGHSC